MQWVLEAGRSMLYSCGHIFLGSQKGSWLDLLPVGFLLKQLFGPGWLNQGAQLYVRLFEAPAMLELFCRRIHGLLFAWFEAWKYALHLVKVDVLARWGMRSVRALSRCHIVWLELVLLLSSPRLDLSLVQAVFVWANVRNDILLLWAGLPSLCLFSDFESLGQVRTFGIIDSTPNIWGYFLGFYLVSWFDGLFDVIQLFVSRDNVHLHFGHLVAHNSWRPGIFRRFASAIVHRYMEWL